MSKTRALEGAVIRTRLAPPRVGNAPVNRDKLLQRLDAHRDRKLTLILGPAGSGKTMLLAQWRKRLAEAGARVAWFNLGSDDDVTLVAAYLVESLRSADLDIRTEELVLFNRSGGKSRNSFLASLIDDLTDCDDEIYLIIDDLHHSTAFGILQLLDALLDVLPAKVHLVCGTRLRPLLNLGKLQMQDQLAELDFSDLRFDLDETQTFVRTQGLPDLTPDHIRRLHEMSEGWAAGLQLLLFSLRKEGQVERFFERHESKPALSQEAALASYLDSNVADSLDAEALDFLCSISVCRRFNAELCEVLTGNPSAHEILRKIEGEQLFLLPIDTPDVDTWYRFHRLFETFLHSRLQRRGEDAIRTLRRSAARWFAGQRLIVEALRYAGEAGDEELMVELIDRSARRMSAAGQFRQLIRWCAQLPAALYRERLNIRLNLAWAQISCGHFDDFRENIEGILVLPEHETPLVEFEIQLLRAYGCASLDDSAGIVGIVEPMLQAALPADPFLLSQISSLALTGYTFSGRFALGREAIRIFHKHLPQEQPQHRNYVADAMIGSSYLAEGRIRDALAHLIPFKDNIVLRGKVGPDVLGNLIGSLCEALYQFNLLDEATELSETYGEMVDAAELPGGILTGYRIRARLESVAGRVQSAFQTLQRLEEIGLQRRLDRLIAWSLYDQFGLALRTHHLTSRDEIYHRLVQLAEKYADFSHCAIAEIPMLCALATAEKLLYEKASPRDCLERIDIAENHCRNLGRGAMQIQLGYMRCIVLLNDGKQAQSLNAASDLLCRAEEMGALRVLADLGEIAHPLAVLLGSRERSDAARAVLDVVPVDGPHGASAPSKLGGAQEQLETLTDRERDVLEQLGKGYSAKSIGRVLDISPTTVKWHLKNAYAKLGANFREEALSKARHHRIIS